MRIASLFSGIGGFEVGMSSIGAKPVIFCENDDSAKQVLMNNFPGTPIADDVRKLEELPASDLLVAGWPCQDLSQAGQVSGLRGDRSSLIEDVFRIIENSGQAPKYILLENVAFALSLKGGEALRYATEQLEAHGYDWAFRIIDSNYFGLPQRRRRLFILGSMDEMPENILFDRIEKNEVSDKAVCHAGFYWTEGNRGLGWTGDAIPPLKGGSNLSIPSPPAIWDIVDDTFYTPSLRDAERLQGFPVDWTIHSSETTRASEGQRWRQVGNAVSVPVARWLGERLLKPSGPKVDWKLESARKGANAGWGGPNRDTRYFAKCFEGPHGSSKTRLNDFGLLSTKPLSERAAKGFLKRYLNGTLRENEQFSSSLSAYCESITDGRAPSSRAA